MRDDEKNKTINRYNKRLEKFGDDPRTLGWTKGKQNIRFEVLTQIGDLQDSAILDVGCGFGDLYGFLKTKTISFDYSGLDINKNLIDVGQEKYPNAYLFCGDFEQYPFNREYDWIISSGMFNYKIKNNIKFIKNSIQKMFRTSKRGVAIDFISSYVNYEDKDVYYSHPETIFRFCKSLSRRVTLRHDYLPFEFCVYIYKQDQYNENSEFC